eukprot:GDKI01017275.1.p2 GENE.GDKI01017275.1~~GDKI01017275.1.p2  ORF type:complete len:187 (-),score=48.14 GDKI01017275.1:39-569(-)
MMSVFPPEGVSCWGDGNKAVVRLAKGSGLVINSYTITLHVQNPSSFNATNATQQSLYWQVLTRINPYDSPFGPNTATATVAPQLTDAASTTTNTTASNVTATVSLTSTAGGEVGLLPANFNPLVTIDNNLTVPGFFLRNLADEADDADAAARGGSTGLATLPPVVCVAVAVAAGWW